ncbi:RagB/SusD family nutrient uptake outer membrane protein [Ulvibacterium sp.]|uniref:RagB/SusD family nutrient uptake outer membrane protein n=1 Tax=Ulvibacterium sp. TaxID=2665914 RepID=UPI003BA9DE42
MKNLLNYFTCTTLVFFLAGCDSEEYLEEEPRDIITADNLFANPEGFQNGLNALYASARDERQRDEQGFFFGTRGWIAQGATDDTYSSRFGSRGLYYVEFGGNLNATVQGLNNVWQWLYENINTANTIIGRAENPNIEWSSDEEKQIVIAEARMVRAWAYRHLTYLWGDVPLILEESSGNNIRTDFIREPVANILNVMEADWLFAEEHLPDINNVVGRPVKGAAQHYLAELYLQKEDFISAEEKAMAVISNTNYSLVTQRYGVRASEPGVPFMDQFFKGNTLRSQGNTEVLWEMPHDRDAIGGGGNVMRRSWLIRYSVLDDVPISPERGRGTDFYAVTKHAWELYEENDDRGSEFAVVRFVLTTAGDTIPTTIEDRQEPTRDPLWPSTAKWHDGDPTDLGRNEGYNDQPYLRLGETYLLLAEAQFRGGDVDSATQTLNILRNRSNASPITEAEVNIDFILDERTRELITEEQRRYTLLRLGKWLERTRLYNSQSGPLITERDRLLPIPQPVIDANLDLEFPQNPGY